MRKIHGLIAIVLASTTPLLSSCAAVGTVSTISDVVAAANKPADQIFNTLADEKAYYGLLAFEVQANRLASTAVDMGFVRAGSPTAIKIADGLVTLTAVVEAAKSAKNLNDATTLHAKIAEGKSLSKRLMAWMS